MGLPTPGQGILTLLLDTDPSGPDTSVPRWARDLHTGDPQTGDLHAGTVLHLRALWADQAADHYGHKWQLDPDFTGGLTPHLGGSTDATTGDRLNDHPGWHVARIIHVIGPDPATTCTGAAQLSRDLRGRPERPRIVVAHMADDSIEVGEQLLDVTYDPEDDTALVTVGETFRAHVFEHPQLLTIPVTATADAVADHQFRRGIDEAERERYAMS